MEKLSLKDITKNNKLSSKEILEIKEMVDAVNKFIEENPEYIEYLRERYPKNNPRLSELNYKMDQMLSASQEYIDTHFPENQRLFNRLRESTKKSIKLTDPKTYKDAKIPDTYYKLLSADYVNNHGSEKKTIKLSPKNKKSPSRFLAKEKREDTSRARWLKKA